MYKVGDKVRIKSIDWYNENKDKYGTIMFSTDSGDYTFTKEDTHFCGRVVTIEHEGNGYYLIVEDDRGYFWIDEMIEGLSTSKYNEGDFIGVYGYETDVRIEEVRWDGSSYSYKVYLADEETWLYNDDIAYKKNETIEELVEEVFIKANDIYNEEYSKGEYCHEQSFKWGFQEGYNYSHEKDKLEILLKEGYQFKDENGNIINATKIILDKKHDDKLKLVSTKKVKEYWSVYARIFIEIYDDNPNECVFTHLWVVDEQRQKGHGKRALIEAETIAKELGCHTAYLKVETNSWMHHWYLRCGYQWYKNAPDNYTWLIKHL